MFTKPILYATLLSFPYFGFCYDLPPVNLGFTSFLDGGPPKSKPGFVFQGYTQYYQSDNFLDYQGNKITPLTDSDISVWVSLSQLLWATKLHIGKARLGFDLILPYVCSSKVSPNPINLQSSGSGFGNLTLGTYLQWDAIIKNNRPVFVHRTEFSVTLPTGKSRAPGYAINPGRDHYSLTIYWAATRFFTQHLSSSWRIHYLYCSKDTKTQVQAGQSSFLNYTLGYRLNEVLLCGLNGYYLKQLSRSKKDGAKINNSKESLLSAGPGVLFLTKNKLKLFANLFFELSAKNRSKGTRINLRLVKNI